jgi:hypothetical protein
MVGSIINIIKQPSIAAAVAALLAALGFQMSDPLTLHVVEIIAAIIAIAGILLGIAQANK